MELEKAKNILAHIVSQRVRWGKMYDASDIGMKDLTDALLAISQGDVSEAADLRQSLTTANRQNAAAKARESRYQKQVENLKNEVSALTALVERLSGEPGGNSEGSSEDGERED